MKVSTLSYSMKQGVKNIKRNKMFSLASIGTIMACIFLFGIFYAIVANFQYMVKSAETSVNVTVFFDDGISQEQIDKIGEQIKKRVEVSEVKFISAEEAWEKFKKEYFKDMDELLVGFNEDNPLQDSASYEIYLNDVAMQPTLVKYLEHLEGIRQVNSSEATATGLEKINLLVAYISMAIIIILLAVAVFLISNTVTIGITVRKEEISIMKLIGATDFFVKAPFIVEGVIIGIVGSIIPVILLYFVYNKVIDYVSTKFNILSGILTFLPDIEVFKILLPVSLVIGIGIGFFGSFITIRKHLRV